MNTGSMKPIYYDMPKSLIFLILCIAGMLFGCGKAEQTVSQPTVQEEESSDEELTEGSVILSNAELASYGEITECLFQEDRETLSLTVKMPSIPKSDDPMIYLFAFDLYETDRKSVV